MNKKLLSSCLVLSICAIAMAPIYKQLDLSSSNTIHPMTEWQQLNLEKVSSARQQLLYTDDTVTYPQNEETVALQTSEVDNLSSRGGVTAKSTTPTTKSTTSTKTNDSPNKATASTPTKRTAVKPAITTAYAKTASTTTYTKAATTSTPISNPVTRTSTASRGTTTTSSVPSSKASAVISTAKSFIGVPYVWGGTTPSGFDCSGFTQYVLSKNGISVPRTASAQYTVGTSVSKSDLRIGDLVFFTTYKAGASHLGFYIGDGNFIHASTSKGVTISSLSNPYYASHYIGARRVIN